MNGTIFGIGPLEVLVIGILILLIFGPQRLPEFTRGLGNALRKLRETYVSFTQEFRGELEPIAQDIDSVTREIRQEVEAIREAADIRSILKPYADDVNKAMTLQAVTPETKPFTTDDIIRMNTSPAKAATNGTANAVNGTTQTQTSSTPSAPLTTSKPGVTPNGRGPARSPAASPALADLVLNEDNPWANIGAPVRSDKLDDDSPWRL